VDVHISFTEGNFLHAEHNFPPADASVNVIYFYKRNQEPDGVRGQRYFKLRLIQIDIKEISFQASRASLGLVTFGSRIHLASILAKRCE
jgi:hypothetical protein